MARNINEFKINLDWVILGESKIDGDYTIEEKSGTYSAIAKQNGRQNTLPTNCLLMM